MVDCTVVEGTDCLMEIFPTEQAALEACKLHWGDSRRARIVKTNDATALVIGDNGAPDPAKKIEIRSTCFVVYSEG